MGWPVDEDYYSKLEDREIKKANKIPPKPECDCCKFTTSGYWCPCKEYIEFLEKRGRELARDRRELEKRINEIDVPDRKEE